MEHQKKTIFITGSSSGIGRAATLYFISKGWNVVATMLHPDKEAELKDSNNILLRQVDVTDVSSIQAAFNEGINRFGRIDVVLNNAGYGLLGPVELATEAQIKNQFDVNVLGTVNATRIAIEHFRKEGGGVVINISSMLGKVTLPFFSMYAATKFAIEGFSEGLYYELSNFNIRVKLIEPGTIKTNFFTSSVRYAQNSKVSDYDSYWKKVITNITERGLHGEDPAVVAKMIYKAATDGSNKLRYPVDRTAKLLIFLRAISPLWLFRFIIKNTIG